MFEVAISTKQGTKVNSVVCTSRSCLIGKDPDCLVVLYGWKVAKKHAELAMRDDGLYITDLGSSSGVQINGEKVSDYGPLNETDVIGIHGYRLTVRMHTDSRAVMAASHDSLTAQTGLVVSGSDMDNEMSLGSESRGLLPLGYSDNTQMRLAQEWREKIHKLLLEQMDLRRLNTFEMTDIELRRLTSELLGEVMVTLHKQIPVSLNCDELAEQVLNESVGLGPLEGLLAQDDISEIMVNCADEIFFEKAGRLYKSDITFTNDQAVMFAIERIVAPLGRRIDESSPMVDARLKDGSRVNAVIPPLSLKGPCITIRKFSKEPLTAERLIDYGSISRPMVEFLRAAILHRYNVVISGGTGSGKTTLLNVLSSFIPDDERIITVEDAAELQLFQPNLISLEARPPNQEGKGAVTIRDLIRNCLRMRPDRIVVGECRGGETLDMLQAMNTGHDGSLTTIHANSPRDCISRLEVMVMMSGMELPVQAIREQISSAVHLIVQQTRFSCGARKVTSVTEVSGIENGRLQMGEIFRFEQSGRDADGRIQGRLIATGQVPEIYENLRERGINVDISMFEAGATHAH
ncbi:ATPase, T2SS/T4P/T4SS family [Halopseudomonas yangmingensis]|uniref:Pilus assembly protein CpaF n=1 Tax=Halopseudomonas yangmingensis TaxID=1720063 RepID=A0A1I4ULL9_9GAMM|nr:ATPase, T2SS/T4P/T4SS family [Halopseudomonas yangmingensis]SFM89872.1 pilus assembly protein CpaF [Halopseudomonas yangmingensis]